MTRKLRKTNVIIVTLLLFLAIFSGCSFGQPAQQNTTVPDGYAYPKMKLNLNSIYNENTSKNEAAKKFVEEIFNATGGNIEVSLYPNDQLSGGNQSKAIEMVRNGSLDMDLHSGMIYSNLDDRFAVCNMPFLFKNEEEATNKLDGAGGEAIGALMEENGVHLLCFFENGMRQLTTNGKLVKNVSDLKGMKIRLAAVPLYLESFAAMGANPIAMNFSELYTALQQGTVDGGDNTPEEIKLTGHYEVLEYVTVFNWSYDPAYLCINKKLWDSLDPEVQKVFNDAAKSAAAFQRELARKNNSEALDELVADGFVERYVATPEEVAGFKAACEPVIKKYREKFGAEFMAAFD